MKEFNDKNFKNADDDVFKCLAAVDVVLQYYTTIPVVGSVPKISDNLCW